MTTRDEVADLQTALKALGADPGPIDGILGRQTRAALREVASWPDLPRPRVPWVDLAKKLLGLHEVRDNDALKAFLRSDGHALGDPAKLPWCGDFVETCIRKTLPGEAIPDNPYFARNWLDFGVIGGGYGSIAVFERGPSAGHVAFVVAQDSTHYHCLGGNQSDSVSIARIAKGRLLDMRWPRTAQPAALLPNAPEDGAPISANEA